MELAITSTSMKLRDRAPVVFRGEDVYKRQHIESIQPDLVWINFFVPEITS